MKRILLFASGGGSNAEAIIKNFKDSNMATVIAIVVNNPDAGVIQIAKQHKIDVVLITRQIFELETFLDTIDFYQPDLLVLAGFLWKIPKFIVTKYNNKILNIHPSLLPKYGGKGMYGHHVHEAVIANQEKESGITIHFVNEEYDQGRVLLQKSVAVSKTDTALTLAKKILALEHEWYSKVIESVINATNKSVE